MAALQFCAIVIPLSPAGILVPLWSPYANTIGRKYCCLKTVLLLNTDRDHALLNLKDLIHSEEALVLAGRQFLNRPTGQDVYSSITE